MATRSVKIFAPDAGGTLAAHVSRSNYRNIAFPVHIPENSSILGVQLDNEGCLWMTIKLDIAAPSTRRAIHLIRDGGQMDDRLRHLTSCAPIRLGHQDYSVYEGPVETCGAVGTNGTVLLVTRTTESPETPQGDAPEAVPVGPYPKAKLVRDRIPQIIMADGHIVVLRFAANKEERRRFLIAKLEEEMRELDEGPCANEGADVLQVIRDIIESYDLSLKAVEERRMDKIDSHGGFQKGTILLDSYPIPGTNNATTS